MAHFAILLGGVLSVTPRLLRQIAGARTISADGGMAHAEELGLAPELWAGDFDSTNELLAQRYAHVPRLTFPREKDATDGEIAIAEALRRGARSIMLVGGLGGQTDHTLGVLGAALRLARQDVAALVTSGTEEAWPLVPGNRIIDLPTGSRISIIPYTDIAGLDLDGVKWPLTARDVLLGSSLTLSNVAAGPVSIAVKSGYGMIIAYPADGGKVIRIEAMGHRGEGLARVDGRPVYIPYALPGESVQAEIGGERGTLRDILEPSPDRIAPFCPHHGTCGGCLLQHWAPQPYRTWKRDLVATALQQRGLDAQVEALLDAHGEGRRRVSLHVRCLGASVIAGFMRIRSHGVHDLDACPILVPGLKNALEIARRIGEVAGDTDAAMTATAGGIDISLKGARDSGEALRLKLAGLVRELGLARLSLHHEPLVERAAPLIAMGRAAVKIAPISFLQATALGEETLAGLVIKAVGKAKRVADLFCGVGPFALRLAERTQVLAADNDGPAVAALAAAVRTTQGLKPVKAASRNLFREPLVPSELEEFDAVVFDPPRAGAEAQARQLARSRVNTVVAVSCDPGTFARDAAILTAGGYRLEQVIPVDQFAWSAHVEVVGVFRR